MISDHSPEGPAKKYMLWNLENIPSTTVHTMNSVSSGNFIDGRDKKDVGINVYLAKPRPLDTHYFAFEFIKCADGTFNIKSLSSGLYLDGRHKGIGNGKHVNLLKQGAEEAVINDYCKWRLKKHDWKGKTCWSIQSVSSELYLNGRNPEHIGLELMITDDNVAAANYKYVLWDLGYAPGSAKIRVEE